MFLLYFFEPFYYTVFFHWLIFNVVHKRLLLLSSIALLILSNSFLAELISRTVRLFKKFFLWSFKVIKQVLFLLMSIRSNISLSTFSVICFPSMSILSLVRKHLPPRHKFSKLFHRNTIKVSYSCIPNLILTNLIFNRNTQR